MTTPARQPQPQRCKHGGKTKDGKIVCMDNKGCDYQRWKPDCRTLLFCSASHTSVPAPDEKCYIITENGAVNHIREYMIGCEIAEHIRDYILGRLRSCPHTRAPAPEHGDKLYTIFDMIALAKETKIEAAKAERERVLDEAISDMKKFGLCEDAESQKRFSISVLQTMRESLRAQQENNTSSKEA